MMVALYCIPMTMVKSEFAMDSWQMTAALAVITLIVILYVSREKLAVQLGLTSWIRHVPFYAVLPVFFMPPVNLIFGVSLNYTGAGLLFAVLSMAMVGFLEEVIFRGLLFKAIAKENMKEAVVITSLTFGIGHISNLFTGQNLLETLLQIVYAICIGCCFVMVFLYSGSLWPCILSHSLIDICSLFGNPQASEQTAIIGSVILIALSLGCVWLLKKSRPAFWPLNMPAEK